MVSERERDDLRAALEDVLREKCGITDLRRPFRCPSPEHEDRGPSARYYEKGHTVHCFGCGKTWDVFQLVGELDGIEAFPDQVKAVADIVGYALSDGGDAGQLKRKPRPKPKAPAFDKPKAAGGADCAEACGAAFAELYAPGNECGREWLFSRGLSDGDASKWGLGFTREPRSIMPEFKVCEPDAAGFITIPFWGKDFREARYCMLRTVPSDGAEIRCKEWRPAGIASPLWREWLLWSRAPVVIVAEGLIDAMAIEKLFGKPTMALGGTANAKRLSQVLNALPADRRPEKIVVAMDEDEAGHAARDRICADLDRLGVAHALQPAYPGGAKDADEWLMAGRGTVWEFEERRGSLDGGPALYYTRWL